MCDSPFSRAERASDALNLDTKRQPIPFLQRASRSRSELARNRVGSTPRKRSQSVVRICTFSRQILRGDEIFETEQAEKGTVLCHQTVIEYMNLAYGNDFNLWIGSVRDKHQCAGYRVRSTWAYRIGKSFG
jgi:hypothetical protein